MMTRTLWLVALALVLGACSQEATPEAEEEAATEVAEAPAPQEGGLAAATEEAAQEDDPYLAFAHSLNEGMTEELIARASQDTWNNALEERLKQAVIFGQMSDRKKPEDSPIELLYDETLQAFYTERELKPVFTQDGRLTPAAEEALKAILDVASHGLDPKAYRTEELARLAEKANENADRLASQVGLELFPREQEGLAVWLEVQGFDVQASDARAKAMEMLLSTEEDNPIPRLRRAFDFYTEQQQRMTEAAVEAEVKLADIWARYTKEFRHANFKRLSEEEIKKYGDRIHPKDKLPLLQERITAELTQFATFDSAEVALEHIEGLWPNHPHYFALRDAYRRYQKIVEEGGWPEVVPGNYNKGGSAPSIGRLKKRLFIEGLYEGPLDDFYDQNLTEAIKAYQETHQLEITGSVRNNDTFWRSLNISAERRTDQIEANLQLWHKSLFQPRDYFVWVNIPDFHAEVWKDGIREMRFRVVVGNNDMACDRRKREKFLVNATPIMHSQLEYLVFNPYWNVPERIQVEEIEPILKDDPGFLARHNYEYHNTSDGTRILRQKPGPENALGLVKFIFPNRHNTYMHDTPKKGFFDYPERAFSHGCVRVQKPMEFAQFILKEEGKWDKGVIDEYLYKRGQTEIYLEKPVDVFVEYYTAQVDEHERVHFLADVYKYVEHTVDPPSHAELACIPQASVAKAADDLGP